MCDSLTRLLTVRPEIRRLERGCKWWLTWYRKPNSRWPNESWRRFWYHFLPHQPSSLRRLYLFISSICKITIFYPPLLKWLVTLPPPMLEIRKSPHNYTRQHPQNFTPFSPSPMSNQSY